MAGVGQCNKQYIYYNDFQKHYLMYNFHKVTTFEIKYQVDWNLMVMWLQKVLAETPNFSRLTFDINDTNSTCLINQLQRMLFALNQKYTPCNVPSANAYNYVLYMANYNFKQLINQTLNDLTISKFFNVYKVCAPLGIYNLNKLKKYKPSRLSPVIE